MSAEPTTWKEELLARVRAAERSEPRKRDQLDPETLADVLLLDAGLASASREAAFDLPFPHLLQISRTLNAAREAAERGIRAAGSSGTAVTVARICIDGHSVSRPGEPRLLVEYYGLDEALRRGTLVDAVEGHEDVDELTLLRAPRQNVERTHTLWDLRMSRADGRIGQQAADVVRAASEDTEAIILRLSRERRRT